MDSHQKFSSHFIILLTKLNLVFTTHYQVNESVLGKQISRQMVVLIMSTVYMLYISNFATLKRSM